MMTPLRVKKTQHFRRGPLLNPKNAPQGIPFKKIILSWHPRHQETHIKRNPNRRNLRQRGGYMDTETGRIETAESGEQYFIMGKNRIKITEHFPATGKQVDELIADLITNKIKEKVGKIA